MKLYKWRFLSLDLMLVVAAWVAGAGFGIFAYHTPPTELVYRDGISNGSTLIAVNKNFDGPPQMKHQTIAELPTADCDVWTESPSGETASKWYVIRCVL